jgi:hypothetical protein
MNVTSNVDPALFRVHAFITVVDSALGVQGAPGAPLELSVLKSKQYHYAGRGS